MSVKESEKLLAFLERNPGVRQFHSRMMLVFFVTGVFVGLVIGFFVNSCDPP